MPGPRAGAGGAGGSRLSGGRTGDESSGYSIALTEIVDRLGLMRVAGGHLDLTPVRITTSEVNRPGLQLTGYLEAFSSDRLQIIGWIETAYLSSLEPSIRAKRLDDYFALGFPALIVARGLHVMPDMVAAADHHDVPVFVTGMDTSPFASALTWLLIHALAPRQEIEAGLVDVHGEGVLILGDERLGKSETILELVRRGHRLIADDLVELRRISADHLRGRALPGVGFVISIPGVGVGRRRGAVRHRVDPQRRTGHRRGGPRVPGPGQGVRAGRHQRAGPGGVRRATGPRASSRSSPGATWRSSSRPRR